MKLAIITTHPIQYNAPMFKMLANRGKMDVKVFYTWSQSAEENKYDPDFGRNIKWDIPLLDGYEYTFVKNISTDPGSHHNKGIINPTLIKEIEQWNANAVLVYGWNFHSHLNAIRFFYKKIKVIFRGDSTLLDEKKGIKNFLKTIYLKWVYRHIDVALYTGLNNKAYYKKYGVSDNKLVFAPHAIDNDRFSNSNQNFIKDWRKTLGINSDDVVILFAGKLEPKKNPEILLKTFLNYTADKSQDAFDNKSFHLLIVGNGVLEEYLKKSYQNAKIHFIDFQNQQMMPSIYNACDIFVLPSSGPGETWGLSVNEAMACRKPVIVSNKCGCAIDLVKEGLNGSVFIAGNMNSLINSLTYLNSKGDLLKMGSESFNIIQHWSYEAICESLESIIN